MSFDYSFPGSIDLFVRGRINKEDADRQTRTVKAILERLKKQPGLILADEVGMGKTFVALGVAISVFLAERRPTVIMIPPNLVEKWPNDFRLFCEACVTDTEVRQQLRCAVARRPEEFLKYLDDDEPRRSAIIFLTHGALTRNMGDGWIKLAILQKALHGRHDTSEIYKSLSKYAGVLIEKQAYSNKDKNGVLWSTLLSTSPAKWKKIINNIDKNDRLDDDPVPTGFLNQLNDIKAKDLQTLFDSLRNEMPRRTSENIKSRLAIVREILSNEARVIWGRCLANIKHDLPLLVFDEAHHLKNSQTKLVTKLFQEPDAEADAGMLTGQFDRMLFLTATPFQLGHAELVNVLDRFASINWNSVNAPSLNLEQYKEELRTLRKQLDYSQVAAKKLDSSWGKLNSTDLSIAGDLLTDPYTWWNQAQKACENDISQPGQKGLE